MSEIVIVSPEAEAQIKTIDRWWRENRSAAPDLFIQELSDAVAMLETMPLAGHRVRHPEVKGLRRILLRATRYHLYYLTDQETTFVLALWSSVRGAGPDLKRLL
jgi:plasmid stabilization system protein ParE